MDKEMETSSVFFSDIPIDAVHAISGNEAYGRTGLEAESGGSLVFAETCWGEQSQRQLAERVGITPPSMTVALTEDGRKRLCEHVRQDEKDQRVVTRIQLAPKGEECIDGIHSCNSVQRWKK